MFYLNKLQRCIHIENRTQNSGVKDLRVAITLYGFASNKLFTHAFSEAHYLFYMIVTKRRPRPDLNGIPSIRQTDVLSSYTTRPKYHPPDDTMVSIHNYRLEKKFYINFSNQKLLWEISPIIPQYIL